MGLFNFRKKKPVEEPVVVVEVAAEPTTIDYNLTEEQSAQLRDFLARHEGCEFRHYDVICRTHVERGLRVFVSCGECNRGEELVSANTPPNKLT